MDKTKQLIFSNGERYPMLVDINGNPDYWVTLYVTVNLRPKLSQTAITNVIRDIKHLRLFEEINQRDLLAEMGRGIFLSDSDVVSVRDHCMLGTEELRKWSESLYRNDVTKSLKIHPTGSRQFARVGKSHTANRIKNIANYLDFTARTILRSRSQYPELIKKIDHMRTRLLAQRPKGFGRAGIGSNPDDKAPNPKVFEELMLLIKEDSPNNPYKNPKIRNRNALIFDLLYETGVRAGELLGLRIEDIDFRFHTIQIRRRHDDIDDPRPQQPVAKTLERTIPIKEEISKRLRKYIMEVRANIPGANKHPFIFVTHHGGKCQGNPISDSTFRKCVLSMAINNNKDLFDGINRHGFRHNFNFILSKKIDEHNKSAKINSDLIPISEKDEIQIRKQLNGWSSDDTAQTYNLRHIRELAENIIREDLYEQSKHIDKVK